ncbi:MAG: hypothetical protein ACRDXC_08670, partial [Acidimicrobiales bacterium]
MKSCGGTTPESPVLVATSAPPGELTAPLVPVIGQGPPKVTPELAKVPSFAWPEASHNGCPAPW